MLKWIWTAKLRLWESLAVGRVGTDSWLSKRERRPNRPSEELFHILQSLWREVHVRFITSGSTGPTSNPGTCLSFLKPTFTIWGTTRVSFCAHSAMRTTSSSGWTCLAYFTQACWLRDTLERKSCSAPTWQIVWSRVRRQSTTTDRSASTRYDREAACRTQMATWRSSWRRCSPLWLRIIRYVLEPPWRRLFSFITCFSATSSCSSRTIWELTRICESSSTEGTKMRHIILEPLSD